jgi:hypothetical protein
MAKNPPTEEQRLPAPSSPEPSEPPPSWVKWLLGKRYLIIAVVILAFVAAIFSISETKRVTHKPPPEAVTSMAPEVKHEVTPTPEPTKPLPPPSMEALERPALPEHIPETKPHPAKPPIPAEHVAEPVKGEAFTRALIKIMDDQVNQTWIGWRPNTILFGILRLTDNVNNIQLGVLEVARRTTVILNENMTRFAVTEAYNAHINEAMNFFMVSADKYWFPSASGKYREAIVDLHSYIDDLKNRRSKFYPRVDNLIVLMATYKDILGSCFHNLIKDSEADGRPVSWFIIDDYFYYSKGVALGMHGILEAVKEDFGRELLKKNSHKLLEDAMHALHTGSHLNPWVVTNGGKDGILANHRANMATYIGEAEHFISTLQTVLATN